MRWIDRLADAPVGAEGPIVWLVRPDGPEAAAALARVRPTDGDLADAAVWTCAERGAARLRRRLLLRVLAAAAMSVTPDAVVVERQASGRPRIASPRLLHASIARYGEWAALALAVRPVGVDLEAVRPAEPLPIDALAPADRAKLLRVRDPDVRARRFARLWTAQEAYAKAEGEPLWVARANPIRTFHRKAGGMLAALVILPRAR